MEDKPLRVVKLTAENIKRISAVEITPTGDVIVIGGKNGAGKSSVLDSIAYALGGQKLVAAQPVRRGQEKGRVRVDLGDIVVTRSFTATGGGQLVVSDKDGKRQTSPQAILDRLVGRLSFDPLAFATMEPAKQRDTLREIAGLDLTDLDAQRVALYEKRREANAEVRTRTGALSGLPVYEGITEKKDTDAIRQQIADAQRIATEARAALDEVTAARASRAQNESQIKQVDDRLAALERERQELTDRRKHLAATTKTIDALIEECEAKAKAAADDVPSIDALTVELSEAHGINQKVDANGVHRQAADDLRKARKRADELDGQISRIDSLRLERIGAAKFPIDGLVLSDGAQVEYKGVPFEQLSAGEKLRISVAVGLALNPSLKVLLIREGSILDSDGLKLVAELAHEADAQVWLERVAESKEGVSVLIEDGTVAADEP